MPVDKSSLGKCISSFHVDFLDKCYCYSLFIFRHKKLLVFCYMCFQFVKLLQVFRKSNPLRKGFIEILLKLTLVKLLTFRRMSFDQFINDSIPII